MRINKKKLHAFLIADSVFLILKISPFPAGPPEYHPAGLVRIIKKIIDCAPAFLLDNLYQIFNFMMRQRFHFKHKVNSDQKMKCFNIGNLESAPTTSSAFVFDDPFKINVFNAIARIMESLNFRFFEFSSALRTLYHCCSLSFTETRFLGHVHPILNIGVTDRHIRIDGSFFERFIIADPERAPFTLPYPCATGLSTQKYSLSLK